jgi:pyruvate ferredoxin oxidoreductase gamma subunit
MAKLTEIKWYGRSGQGVHTAASILAEIMALEGKYVQAFPELNLEQNDSHVQAFNRVSDSPVKLHSALRNTDVVVVLDPAMLLHESGDFGILDDVHEDTVYIVNTPLSPETVKERLHIAVKNLYTVDADTIAKEEFAAYGAFYPNIPVLAVLIEHLEWMPVEHLIQRLQTLQDQKWEHELVNANIKAAERAISEVRQLPKEDSTTILEL